MNKPKLILIHGYSGTGKSTVSKKLAEKYRYALLPADVFFFSVTPPICSKEDDNKYTLDTIVDCTKNYMRKKRDIIIEGALVNINPSDPVDLDRLIDLAQQHNYELYRFVLTADRETCIKRMKQRHHLVPDHAYDMIVSKVHKTQSKETITLDTSKDSILKIIKRIEKIIF